MIRFRAPEPKRSPTIERVAKLVEIRRTSELPQRDTLILMDVEARLQTVTPLLRAGLLAEARETTEQAAAGLVLVAMLIGGQATATEQAR